MTSWLIKILKKQANLEQSLTSNPQGLDDGGANISGGLFDLMSKNTPKDTRRFKKRRRRKNVHKKINPSPLEHPGEQSDIYM